MGSRFSPCMKAVTLNSFALKPKTYLRCIPGMKKAKRASKCTLEQICGIAPLSNPPNQWYRFIMAIFLHGGVVHFLMNMQIQFQVGFPLERAFGTHRLAIIYIIAGVGGFVFSGIFTGTTSSVGCSGALYGLMACFLLDLIQNWKLMLTPYKTLFMAILQILVSFFVGFFPGVDNYAHVGMINSNQGGFLFGLLSGLIFMPKVSYGRLDKYSKYVTGFVAAPLLIAAFVLVFKLYYSNIDVSRICPWCKYLNCVDPLPWCAEKWQNTGF